jgi:hypothetical protein
MKFKARLILGLCILGLKVTYVLSTALEANIKAGL